MERLSVLSFVHIRTQRMYSCDCQFGYVFLIFIPCKSKQDLSFLPLLFVISPLSHNLFFYRKKATIIYTLDEAEFDACVYRTVLRISSVFSFESNTVLVCQFSCFFSLRIPSIVYEAFCLMWSCSKCVQNCRLFVSRGKGMKFGHIFNVDFPATSFVWYLSLVCVLSFFL